MNISYTVPYALLLLMSIHLIMGCEENSFAEEVLGEYFMLMEGNRKTEAFNMLDSISRVDSANLLTWHRASIFLDSDWNLRGVRSEYPLEEIMQCKSMIEILDYEKGRSILKKLESDHLFKEKFPFDYFWLESKIPELDRADHINFVKTNVKERKGVLDMLLFVKGISALSRKLITTSRKELGNAMSGLAIYLFKQGDLDKSYPYTYGKLLQNKGLNLILEHGEDEVVNKFINASANLFEKNNWKDAAVFCKGILINSDENPEFLSVNEIIELDINLSYKISILGETGERLFYKNPVESINYFRKASQLLSHVPCSFTNKIYANYIAMTYAELNQLDSMKIWNKNALGNEKCSVNLKKESIYLNSIIMSDYFTLLYPKKSLEALLDQLFEERSIGLDLMKDDIDHQNDFLVSNTARILSIYNDELVFGRNKQQEIFELFELTKSRDRLVKIAESELQILSQSNSRKKDLLREIDEYDEFGNFDNPVYMELFDVIFAEYEEYYQPSINIDSTEISREEIEPLYFKNNFQVLNVMAMESQYLGYVFENNQLKTFQFDGDSLIKLSYDLDNRIERNQNFEFVCDKIKIEILENIPLDPSKDLIIIPDGKLTGLPLEYLFNEFKSVNIEHSLIEYLARQKLTVDRNKIVSYSYSDSTTITDNSLRTFQELNFGYQETQKINQLLKLNTACAIDNDFKGSSFTVENFKTHLSSDMYHISAHAFSDLDNRLDNYIVIRDESGNAKKLYTYEIEAMGLAPKVVVLSACDTGIGVHKNGKGTYSISRAFMQNGTQTIIKTLWKVDDSATKDFMVDMYTNWNTGISLGEAINKTRTKFEANTVYSVKDWAGFVLEGNPNVFLK